MNETFDESKHPTTDTNLWSNASLGSARKAWEADAVRTCPCCGHLRQTPGSVGDEMEVEESLAAPEQHGEHEND
jgi:hypothetical protein